MGDHPSITIQDVRELLRFCTAVGLPDSIDDDTPVVIDSIAAVWIQHLLAERHGVKVEAADVMGPGRTVSSLHAVLNGSTDA